MGAEGGSRYQMPEGGCCDPQGGRAGAWDEMGTWAAMHTWVRRGWGGTGLNQACFYFSACVPWVMAAPARRAAEMATVSLISASEAPVSRAFPEWISMQ